jgi:hypothetical protein
MTELINSRAVIGDNMPPTPIDLGRAAYREISEFLAENPVVETEEQARAFKLTLDRTKSVLGDIEAAKDADCQPLYATWKSMVATYTPAIAHLTTLTVELKARLSKFMRAQEAIKEAEATRKQQEAFEAAESARNAALEAKEAFENAAVGECNIDLATKLETAESTNAAAVKADHQAQLAEHDSHIRVGGGFLRVATLRTKETLIVTNAKDAIAAIGLTEKISDAILTGARAYRKLHGTLPPGIGQVEERSL